MARTCSSLSDTVFRRTSFLLYDDVSVEPNFVQCVHKKYKANYILA